MLGPGIDDETAALCRSPLDPFDDPPPASQWTAWSLIATQGTFLTAALAALVSTGWITHVPVLDALRGVEQDRGWHPEGDVFTHAGLAADLAARLADAAGLTEDDRAVVVLAALLHDVGKVTHTEHRRRPDGSLRITSHGHAEAGVGPARDFLRRVGAPSHLQERILPLVREHMATASTASPSAGAVTRLAHRLAPATMAEWALVCDADKGGRGPGSVSGGTDRWMRLAAELGLP